MSDINRREALTLLALAPLAATTGPRTQALAPEAVVEAVVAPPTAAELKFFTAHEFATVTLLANLILPADERSGSASDAGVPEFIDFILSDVSGAGHQGPVRGGLGWLDAECRRRFQQEFVGCTDAQRAELLDEISRPGVPARGTSHGVAFFNRFRDLVASGFWSSKMGIADLQYIGNVPVPNWDGCPPEALRKLGVRYT